MINKQDSSVKRSARNNAEVAKVESVQETGTNPQMNSEVNQMKSDIAELKSMMATLMSARANTDIGSPQSTGRGVTPRRPFRGF